MDEKQMKNALVQNEDAYMLDEVSYWMPLPEPPEEV